MNYPIIVKRGKVVVHGQGRCFSHHMTLLSSMCTPADFENNHHKPVTFRHISCVSADLLLRK
jgi:hypothetical protein